MASSRKRSPSLPVAFLVTSLFLTIFQIQTLLQIYLFQDYLPASTGFNFVLNKTYNETPQTHFLERRYKGSLLYTCTLRPRSEANHNEAWRQYRLATVIVFQSNSGYQLQNFMAHYLPVIGSKSIVIIDHHMDGRAIDPETVTLLGKHSKLGSDVWRCDGSFLYKAEMWSDVVNQYKSSSEFVFPLDVDEYITVIKPQLSSSIFSTSRIFSTNSSDRNKRLHWNKKDLSHALLSLQQTGMPFKMEGGIILPSDCGNITWPGNPLDKRKYVARKKGRRVTCMDKVFMRGKDFEATDGGNHIGKTHNSPQRLCPLDPLPEQRSELFLIHMQVSNFDEWLLHGLRGAAARGYNKFTDLTNCFEGMVSEHYCRFWKQIIGTRLDPWQMKKLYSDIVCKSITETNEPVALPEQMVE